jgi:hypothetical protein
MLKQRMLHGMGRSGRQTRCFNKDIGVWIADSGRLKGKSGEIG